jgi:hypothetical protein
MNIKIIIIIILLGACSTISYFAFNLYKKNNKINKNNKKREIKQVKEEKLINNKLEEQQLIQNNIKNLRLLNYQEDTDEDKELGELLKDDIKLADSNLCEPPKIKEDIKLASPDPDGREVFIVGAGKYGFLESKAVCEKLGSRLASEEEVNRAHKLGANWCDYGWVDGQKAFFTVQEDFHKLMDCKKKPNSANPCGKKQGVHGGKMFNPDLKYGATCFGFKPQKTEKQKKREEEYNKILKNALGTLYKNPTPEQIKEMEDQRYKNILDNLKKEQLVNEVYEFNDLKVKWNNIDNNNIVSIE